MVTDHKPSTSHAINGKQGNVGENKTALEPNPQAENSDAESDLVARGTVGVALIAPAVFTWTARLVEKGADSLAAKFEGTSKTVGTVAGTLHRSFNEAKRAGVAEIRGSSTDEGKVAGQL